jgi:N-acyl-L-homoserine lactone synthetase
MPLGIAEELEMKITCHDDTALTTSRRAALARYRYDVFVGRLGWNLPCEPGYDQDQFDLPQAIHLVAEADDEHILGYARLLPTTGDYLLGNLFPELLGGALPPSDPTLWELSRYAASDTRGLSKADAEVAVGKHVLLTAIQVAAQAGACGLMFCTTVAIERLAMRWGVSIRRLGPPVRNNGQLLVAALIEFTEQTFTALAPQLAPETEAVNPALLPAAQNLGAMAACAHAN